MVLYAVVSALAIASMIYLGFASMYMVKSSQFDLKVSALYIDAEVYSRHSLFYIREHYVYHDDQKCSLTVWGETWQRKSSAQSSVDSRNIKKAGTSADIYVKDDHSPCMSQAERRYKWIVGLAMLCSFGGVVLAAGGGYIWYLRSGKILCWQFKHDSDAPTTAIPCGGGGGDEEWGNGSNSEAAGVCEIIPDIRTAQDMVPVGVHSPHSNPPLLAVLDTLRLEGGEGGRGSTLAPPPSQTQHNITFSYGGAHFIFPKINDTPPDDSMPCLGEISICDVGSMSSLSDSLSGSDDDMESGSTMSLPNEIDTEHVSRRKNLSTAHGKKEQKHKVYQDVLYIDILGGDEGDASGSSTVPTTSDKDEHIVERAVVRQLSNMATRRAHTKMPMTSTPIKFRTPRQVNR